MKETIQILFNSKTEYEELVIDVRFENETGTNKS
jgi:hypothetical protein